MRQFALLLLAALMISCTGLRTDAAAKPNVVIIFADDLGYGDLSCFGHPTIHTPHLDRMAAEGQRWTQFYVAACVCTPSRAGLMTGRYPIRNGMCSDKRRVLFPDSKGGLPAGEITIAAALKKAGYNTGMVGKWHLGHLPQFQPTSHGFDTYYGIPYSNDMDRVEGNRNLWKTDPTGDGWKVFNVPMIHDGKVVEQPVDQRTLTRRYTEHAVDYIKKHKDGPFFLYLAHSMPHIPLFTNDKFHNTSRRGLYGDVIEEIDWSVGRVLDTLRELNIADNTMVVFCSDNGPWKLFNEFGGSSGLLRGEKGATFEGGMREPTIFWWPGKIKPGIVADLGSTLDLLPTACALAGIEAPADRKLDGYDISPTLLHGKASPRNTMFYYYGQQIWAVRKGRYKAHFVTKEPAYGRSPKVPHDPPLLFDLETDPSEQYDIAKDHPDVIADLKALVQQHTESVKPVVDQLSLR